MAGERDALKAVFPKPTPEGRKVAVIKTKKGASTIGFTYAPAALVNKGEKVFCKFIANRMDVIQRNKDVAHDLMNYNVLPWVVNNVKQDNPSATKILFNFKENDPATNFLERSLKQHAERNHLTLKNEIHHISVRSDRNFRGVEDKAVTMMALYL